MDVRVERRLLQAVIGLACLVPLLAGGAGMLHGPDTMRGGGSPPDLDSHFRYLSGLLFGIGLAFAGCIPRIQRNGAAIRLLAFIVAVGGVGRALSLAEIGAPGIGHRLALGMELVVTPLVMLWQWRVARRWRAAGLEA